MGKPLDQEAEAKADIISRPEVTGQPVIAEKVPEKEPLNIRMADAGLDPDKIEQAAGKVISKAVDDLKTAFGMESDKDFTALLSEALGGLFGALRVMSGRPWIRFAVAGSALAFSFVPAFIRYSAAKGAKEGEKE